MRVGPVEVPELFEAVGAPYGQLAQKVPPLVVELPGRDRNLGHVTLAEDLRRREGVAAGIRLVRDAAQVRARRCQRVSGRPEALQLRVIAVAARGAFDDRLREIGRASCRGRVAVWVGERR